MKEFIYEQPLLEEPDFGKFIAGASLENDGEGEQGGQMP